MNQALRDLSSCCDFGSVESGLRALCSGFGPLSRMDVLPMVDAGKSKVVCLLRANSSEHEQILMTQLGAVRFGEDLCLIVDLRNSD
ncbi:MAG: RNA-binding protein [Burkholderiales bacterium]|nr:RNA-binding protein [Burkholderiales bacterium]